jgi:radical SAM protein with 4Fe4S-binding SPASM domain
MKAPCGAGKKYVAVNHAGDIFPCHRFVQWPEWKIGNVKNGITETSLRSIFVDFDNYKTDPKCAKCDNKFCGGACFASNYSQTGNIYKTSDMACELSKRQWDRSLKIFDELKNNSAFKKQFSNLFNRASKKTKAKLGIENEQARKGHNPNNKINNKQIEKLNQRILKLEKTVSSMSQVVLDLVEGGA